MKVSILAAREGQTRRRGLGEDEERGSALTSGRTVGEKVEVRGKEAMPPNRRVGPLLICFKRCGCLLEVFDENKQTKRPNLGMVLPNLVWSEELASHRRVATRFVWFVQRSEDACGVVCGSVPWESGWGPQVDFSRRRFPRSV